MWLALKVAAIWAALTLILGGSAAFALQPWDGLACGDGACGCGPYGGGLYGDGWPGLYVQERLPYFALYPPVYYSHPVARPYGYSPFAYPPGTITPDVVRPQPLMVVNRFVAQSAAIEKPTKTAGPLRIRNPYVDPPASGLAAFEGLADLPASKPQMVYPTRVK